MVSQIVGCFGNTTELDYEPNPIETKTINICALEIGKNET